MIFYFLEQSLTTNNLPNIFYFSETKIDKKTEQSKTAGTTLKESLDNIIRTKTFSDYDNVYLNFVGLTIRFKGITGNNLVNFNYK